MPQLEPVPHHRQCYSPARGVIHDAGGAGLISYGGGPHGQINAVADIDGGKMDGFIRQATQARKGCADPNNPAWANSATRRTPGRLRPFWCLHSEANRGQQGWRR